MRVVIYARALLVTLCGLLAVANVGLRRMRVGDLLCSGIRRSVYF